MNAEPTTSLLEVRGLRHHFAGRHSMFERGGPVVSAVDGVDLSVARGEIVGLVGESGSGKSTLARCILRLLEPQAGQVRFRGQDLCRADPVQLHAARRRLQVVFQDAGQSLSPRRSIQLSLQEPLEVHGIGERVTWPDRILTVLGQVGLDPEILERLPRQLSAGQQQRVALARALLADPELIIADEAVSALDVSVQAQVLELIRRIRDERKIAFLFISHDLSVVAQLADRVAVMYRGRIVESGPLQAIFSRPAHPYTRALLAAVPDPDPDHPFTPPGRQGLLRETTVPGCRYAPYCADALQRCRQDAPRDRPLEGSAGHHVECWLYGD